MMCGLVWTCGVCWGVLGCVGVWWGVVGCLSCVSGVPCTLVIVSSRSHCYYVNELLFIQHNIHIDDINDINNHIVCVFPWSAFRKWTRKAK